MSDPLSNAGAALQGLGGLASGITGLFNIGFNRRAYWRALEREDSAVQRRVADMKAAGVNPMLAAGSPAQSMSPTQQQTPDLGGFDKGMSALMNKILMNKANTDITKTEAETERVKAETSGINQRNALIQQEFGLKERGVGIKEGQLAVNQAAYGLKERYTDAQVQGIHSSIQRNEVLNTLSRANVLQVEANIMNLHSQMSYRDAQEAYQLIQNEFTKSDYEKWSRVSFPRGGISGIVGATLAAIGFQGGDVKNHLDSTEALNPGLTKLARFLIRGLPNTQIENLIRNWKVTNPNNNQEWSGTSGTFGAGSDRAPAMSSPAYNPADVR